MTLLASSNNPRLQRYCVLVQSKHYGKAPFLLVTLGGTRRFLFRAGVGEHCPVPRHPRASWHHARCGKAASRRGWTDRGDPSAVGRRARAAVEVARMAAGGFWLIQSVSTASCKGDEWHQHPTLPLIHPEWGGIRGLGAVGTCCPVLAGHSPSSAAVFSTLLG